MEFRSKSCRDEKLQIESYSGGKVAPTSMQDLRCYSANYAYANHIGKDMKFLFYFIFEKHEKRKIINN